MATARMQDNASALGSDLCYVEIWVEKMTLHQFLPESHNLASHSSVESTGPWTTSVTTTTTSTSTASSIHSLHPSTLLSEALPSTPHPSFHLSLCALHPHRHQSALLRCSLPSAMEKVQHITRAAIRRASTMEVPQQAKQNMQELFVNFCLILICLLLIYIIVLLM
ncbi:hypothetical protein NFI96_005786 [Prochilodus magdalenae]|nr:hypothetical protein NFI96_005786 [Prochilodus magdalenae]